MGAEVTGKRNGNTWSKAEGKGHKRGYELKSYLENKNAVTLPDVLELSSLEYANELCLGTRKLLERNKIEQNGKTLEKLVLGNYEWATFKEVQNNVLKVAAAMKTLGFEKGHRVVILSETRAEWLVSAIGCLRYGLTVVTLYTNLCNSGLVHGIQETEVDTIFLSYEILPRFAQIMSQCDKVKNVIVFEDQLEGLGSTTLDPKFELISFQKLLTIGNPEELDNTSKPSGEDSAIIMYTSGSTGTPKGVELSHSNIFYSFIAYTIQANLNSKDKYIAYLPLAHIMELVTEVALIALGATIAYSSPFTLTSNSPKIAKGTLGDVRVAKPTAMSAVPLILDRIIKAVSQNVERQGKFQSKMFNVALRKKQESRNSLTNRVLDMVIFNKVKAELGGSVKMMVVGGAPLSPQTHSMILAMFGCTLQVGYGCTETAACVTSMNADSNETGNVGPPNPNVIVKLIDWEEGDYRTTDKPRPRGEIVVGGPCVARGYFKLHSESVESFYVEDGIQWFKTGDIGEFDEAGNLYVVDRKKDLVKLKHGEYISLGNIESKLKTSALIENICVFANSNEDYTVAIICPAVSCLHKIASEVGYSADQSIEKLCVDKKVVETVLKRVKSHAKQCGLGRWDIPQAVSLTTVSWTPDSGLVTAALKLKRKSIEKHYDDDIKLMYGKVASTA